MDLLSDDFIPETKTEAVVQSETPVISPIASEAVKKIPKKSMNAGTFLRFV